MQKLTTFSSRRLWTPLRFSLIIMLTGVISCADRPTTLDKPPAQPHAGATLTIAVGDQATHDLLLQLSKSWANRSGATIRVVQTPFDGTNADIGIIAPAAMPRFAHAEQLAPLPAKLRDRGSPYAWDDLFSAYSTRLLLWRDRVYALPILAEGMVLVYRKAAFDGKDGRPALPPQTWSALANLGPHSLPPLNDPETLAAQFLSAVACYDRPAINRITSAGALDETFFRFLLEAEKGQPRVARPVFGHVALLFQTMHKNRSTAATVVEAFADSRVKAGVLTLAELATLPEPITAQLGVAQLPGATLTYEENGQPKVTAQEAINRVPYFGWGGRVGVVAAQSKNAEAAWDFLAAVGSPEQTANEVIAATRWGAGPFRMSQVDVKARTFWFGYHLSTAETDNLLAALRDNIGAGVQNYRFHLRTPNQHELVPLFNNALLKIVQQGANPLAAFQMIETMWQEAINKYPAAEWRSLTRASLGR